MSSRRKPEELKPGNIILVTHEDSIRIGEYSLPLLTFNTGMDGQIEPLRLSARTIIGRVARLIRNLA